MYLVPDDRTFSAHRHGDVWEHSTDEIREEAGTERGDDVNIHKISKEVWHAVQCERAIQYKSAAERHVISRTSSCSMRVLDGMIGFRAA